jgi:hypothetical protein
MQSALQRQKKQPARKDRKAVPQQHVKQRERVPAMPKTTNRRWSRKVTETSNALDLEKSVFKKGSAKAIAKSLKRSAEHSKRRKAKPFQSAMSMLNFYENRAGKNLHRKQKTTLEKAKDELRALYHRPKKT